MRYISCLDNKGRMVKLPEDKFYKRPSVYAVLRNKDKILVLHNKSNNKLSLPGGDIKEFESYEEALRREMKEETGIEDFRILSLLKEFQNYFYYEPEDLAMDAEIQIYECETKVMELLPDDQIDDGEACKLEWMTIPDAIKYGFVGSLEGPIVECLRSID